MVIFGGHRRTANPGPDNPALSWIEYVCWSCGRDATGAVIAVPVRGEQPWHESEIRWLWCNACGAPAIRTEEGDIRPGARYGPDVPGLPSDVQAAYDEARDCMSVSAYTAAELLCRKVLMYVAVKHGLAAKNDKDRAPTFQQCLDHLTAEGYVTKPMERWVGKIKDNGNEATHELEPPSQARAESTVMFTAQMLSNTYGMEYLADLHTPEPEAAEATEPPA